MTSPAEAETSSASSRAPETTGSRRSAATATTSTSRPSTTLVDEDHNGQFVKFYDARTNGGFAQPPVDAPCAAADECHGADSSPPTPPTITSGADLGASGNVPAREEAKHKKPKRKKSKKKKGP